MPMPNWPNIRLTHMILEAVGADDSMIEYVEDRKGHDRRYAVDSSKIRAMGWSPSHTVEMRLSDTGRLVSGS